MKMYHPAHDKLIKVFNDFLLQKINEQKYQERINKIRQEFELSKEEYIFILSDILYDLDDKLERLKEFKSNIRDIKS